MTGLINIPLEENILGSIIFLNGIGSAVDNAFEILTQRDFRTPVTRDLFNLMSRLRERNLTPDINALASEPEMQDPFFHGYTLRIWKNTSSALNLNHWVKTLTEYTQLRDIQERINSINEIITDNTPIDAKLKEIDNLFSVETGLSNTNDGAKHISQSLNNYANFLDKRWNNPDEVLFTTGLPDLDDILGGGFEIGLHAIGANPKMGKTELMAKIIIHFGLTKKLPVYVGSMEMEDHQMVHRFASSHSQVDKQQILKGFETSKIYNEQQAEDLRIQEALFRGGIDDLRHSNIYIDSAHNNTVKRIRREARKIQKKHAFLGGIFVDYLQLMNPDDSSERRDLEVATMTRALKGMSKEFECPVILLLQLNRSNTQRIDKRPLPSDSRDSGAIEQDVDSWTGLYRDSVFNLDSKWKNITEVIVMLNRHGDVGTCYQALTSRGFIDVDKMTIEKIISEENSSSYKNRTSEF